MIKYKYFALPFLIRHNITSNELIVLSYYVSETFTILPLVLTSCYIKKNNEQNQIGNENPNVRNSMMTDYETNNYTKPTQRFANRVSLSTGCHC